MIIGFVGLSHLGIVSSLAAAAKGFRVIALDSDRKLVDRLSRGDFPIFEKGLEQLHSNHGSAITYSDEMSSIQACDLVYISKDVPTNDQNQSDLGPVEALIRQVIPHLKPKSTLVILCQVSPGFTRQVKSHIPMLRGKDDITVIYQVETLIFGDAVQRALTPERYIIGCDLPSENLPPSLVTFLERFDCPILTMRYESAELAKITINLFLISSVTTANAVSEVCEHLGADWAEIEEALRLDRRIGKFAYLRPGLGISGGNLERDLININALVRRYNIDCSLFDSWIDFSRKRRDWILHKFNTLGIASNTATTIAVWGLAYKPGTHSLKNAPSIDLIQQLRQCTLRVYDPEVRLPEQYFTDTLIQARTAEDALANADVLIVMTPWPEFSSYTLAQIQSWMHGGVVIDPFGVYSKEQVSSLTYITMGR